MSEIEETHRLRYRDTKRKGFERCNISDAVCTHPVLINLSTFTGRLYNEPKKLISSFSFRVEMELLLRFVGLLQTLAEWITVPFFWLRNFKGKKKVSLITDPLLLQSATSLASRIRKGEVRKNLTLIRLKFKIVMGNKMRW